MNAVLRKGVALAALAVGIPASAPAVDWGKLVRRATMLAVCATAGMDVGTTAKVIHLGGVESNGFLARNGQPRWGRIIVLNAGGCMASAVVQEFTGPRMDTTWTSINLALAVEHGYAAAHNLGTIRKLEEGK